MISDEFYVARCSSPQLAWEDRKLILSVDDELNVLYTRYKLLMAEGYAVLSAYDGAQALGLFGQEKIDLVLLDYALPQMDGELVAEAMKSHSPGVPIIIVSGAEVPDSCLAKCNGYVRKGDGPEALLRTIRELLPPVPQP